MTSFWRRSDWPVLLLALVSVAGITAGFRVGLHLINPTTTALTYLLVVLITAATARLWVAVVTSLIVARSVARPRSLHRREAPADGAGLPAPGEGGDGRACPAALGRVRYDSLGWTLCTALTKPGQRRAMRVELSPSKRKQRRAHA